MHVAEQLKRVLDRIADIANSLQTKLAYLLGIGVIASAALAWNFFSSESALWWNVVKCGLVVFPVVVWILIWFVLNQLRDAPSLITELANDDEGVFANLGDFSVKEPDGLRGIFSTIKEFRKEDGFDVIFDTISGIALIANPLFAILAFLSMVLLLILIVITPFVLFL